MILFLTEDQENEAIERTKERNDYDYRNSSYIKITKEFREEIITLLYNEIQESKNTL